MVKNVQVMQLRDSCSEISAVVSWERSENTSVANYTVYYQVLSERMNEMSASVPSTDDSITITNLVSGKEYVFQVAAKVMVSENRFIEGERSESSADSVITFSTPLEALQPRHSGIMCQLRLILKSQNKVHSNYNAQTNFTVHIEGGLHTATSSLVLLLLFLQGQLKWPYL